MKIDKNTVVSVTYELFAGKPGSDKTFVEAADKDSPFTFLFGQGSLIEGFENNLQGLEKGKSFDFNIPVEKAYGPTDNDAVVPLPLDIFKQDGKVDEELLAIGNMVPMNDDEGNRLNGKVISVDEKEVIMDFNHPLAGQELRFSGEVIDIREASKEEIEHGHVHLPGMHSH